jgi:hypothetical protein
MRFVLTVVVGAYQRAQHEHGGARGLADRVDLGEDLREIDLLPFDLN